MLKMLSHSFIGLAIFLPCEAAGQADTIWFSADWSQSEKAGAHYFRPPAVQMADGYLITDYFRAGNTQMAGHFLNAAGNHRHGRFDFFAPSGAGLSTEYYTAGKASGTWLRYDTTGQYLLWDQVYTDDTSSPTQHLFYPGGAVLGIGIVRWSGPDGPWRYFYTDGRLKRTDVFKNGKLNGPSVGYDSATGQIVRKGTFEEDRSVGQVADYLPGKTFPVRVYLQDARDTSLSVLKTYDSLDGSLRSVEEFKHKKRFGTSTRYYPGGAVNFEETTDDEERGRWKFYSRSGVLLADAATYKGKREGPMKFYAHSGALYAVKEYHNHILNGPAVFYDTLTGALQTKGTHVNGVRQGQWEYYKQDASRPWRTERFEAGKLHGATQDFAEDGSLLVDGQYDRGSRTGLWKYYRKIGGLFMEKNYAAGKLEGELKTYFLNAELRRVRLYADGKNVSERCFSHTGSDTACSIFYTPASLDDSALQEVTDVWSPAINTALGARPDTVWASITVDREGRPLWSKILRSTNAALEGEAMRRCLLVSTQTPATEESEPIVSTLPVRITFSPRRRSVEDSR